jgi:hypothetical protein
MLASLWWTEVLARCWSTRTRTTSLLNAQSAAFDNLTLKTFLGSISLLSGDHFDEAKATRFLSVRVKHDLAFLNLTILLEEAGNLGLREARVNASDEKVRTRIDGTIVLGRRATVILGSTKTR